MWELVHPRTEGDYVGKRTIGSANIISAYNILHLKLIEDQPAEIDSLTAFKTVLEELQTNNLIRRSPKRVRETFRTV